MVQLHAGDLVGNRFEIDRAAGRGGMGTVYRARDRYSGDFVALKLLNAGSSGSEVGERFAREAQLLSELHHPGIVSYIAHGQAFDGQRFLAMEWLEGEDLGHRLARGPLTVGQSITLIARVADALAVAHQRGVIHRDLKPTNLFLVGSDLDRVKLLDFGVARRQTASRAMTRTGMVVGTPEYMAPEQARGSRELTTAIDMFALGCVLYECLTGEPPFVAEHVAAVLVRILFEDPVPIVHRRPGMPTSVVALLDDLLHKDTFLRISDATTLQKRLSQLGELPDLPLLPATAMATAPRSIFAESEEVLFSLVAAAGPKQDRPLASTLPATGDWFDAANCTALLSAVRALGAKAEYLVDGALIATIPQADSAQDQAVMAARVALLVKERWPEATVVVATGCGRALGTTVVGDVANRAAQILERRTRESPTSPPGAISGVWLDELSLRLLGPRFSFKKTADGTLLVGEEREVDESRPLLGKPTPCVGRGAELGSLEAQLGSSIDESETRAILITAPPGIGKSRLRHEFMRRVAARPDNVTMLLGRGDMLRAGAPYGILVTAIRRLCGLVGSEHLDEQRQALRARIACHVAPADQNRVVLFIAEICGMPFPAEVHPMLQAARHDPKIMRDAVRGACIDWLRAECTAAPVLLVLDDLQWGDALTVSLLDEALRELHGTSFCLIALARPEVHEVFPSLWQRHSLQEISLKPLSKKACARLVVQVLGEDVDAEVVERAVLQSAGNALFLEELIRSIAEGKPEERIKTVIAMLQARIGRLDAGPRRALRAASVYGQTFWRGGVALLLGTSQSSPELASWLSALVDAEMFQPHPKSRLGNESEYGFRHALVRDAAYGLLTDGDLRLGHRLAGEFLEAAGVRDSIPIAEHFERGGVKERAVIHFIGAADWAAANKDLDSVLKWTGRGISCGATGEALGTLRSLQTVAHTWQDAWAPACACGMEALSLLPRGGLRWCKLMTPLFIATIGTQPQALGELTGLFAAVQPEAEARLAYLEAASWLVGVLSAVGQRAPAQHFLRLLEQASHSLSKSEAAAWGQVRLGQTVYARTLDRDPWATLILSQTGCAFLEQAQDWRSLALLRTYEALAHNDLGNTQEADRVICETTRLAERIREPLAIGIAAVTKANILSTRIDPEPLKETVQIAQAALVAQQANPFILGNLNCALARAFMHLGDLEAAAAAARASCEGLAISPTLRTWSYAVYIQVLLRQGCVAEARGVGAQALQELVARGGGGFAEVALLLALSEAHQAAGDTSAACISLTEAACQMNLRADKIPDPAARERFLTQVPENVRIRELSGL